MLRYDPPVRELQFLLNDVLRVSRNLANSPVSSTEITVILEAAARFAKERLLPLNAVGDSVGCKIANGVVSTPQGFPEAYKAYVEAGWGSLTAPPALSGQGLPNSMGFAVMEMFHSANLSFTDYLGTADAARLIKQYGHGGVSNRYVNSIATGAWSVTQCLTEPQAGSDLGLITARADPFGEAFRINGRKIFISGGDHDMAENIVHLVLARLPGAPVGSRGLSLFLVPKIIVDDQGQLSQRNTVSVTRLEHKMGYAASATCEMLFENAIGWLLGEPHQGLLPIMGLVAAVRLFVGQQGVAQAELAYQNGLAYAKERRQGRSAAGHTPQGSADFIIAHPDVRRNLFAAKAFVAAGRALILYSAFLMDLREQADPNSRADIEGRIALFTPLAKVSCSDGGLQNANSCMDLFGGHGYVRDNGMEQIVRDVRIAQIHEGSNGINAFDFLMRAVPARDGAVFAWFIGEVRRMASLMMSCEDLKTCADTLLSSVNQLNETTCRLLPRIKVDRQEAAAVCVDYLRFFAGVSFAWSLGLSVEAVAHWPTNDPVRIEKIALFRFHLFKVLPLAEGHRRSIESGSAPIMDTPESFF